MIVGDVPDDEDNQGGGRANASWLSESSDTDWTTLEMMKIPQDVSLLDTKKKTKKGSVVRMSRSNEEDDSEEEDGVEVYDSEGESTDQEEEKVVSISGGIMEDQPPLSWNQQQQPVNGEFTVPKRDHNNDNNDEERPSSFSVRVSIHVLYIRSP